MAHSIFNDLAEVESNTIILDTQLRRVIVTRITIAVEVETRHAQKLCAFTYTC